MPNSVDLNGRPFHFIGIGGIGMSALAYVLAKRNLPVSGSDISLSHITQRLQELGAHIFWSQDAANLQFFCFAGDRSTKSDAISLSMVGRSAHTWADLKSASPPELDKPYDSGTLPQVICSTAIPVTNQEYQAALELGCPIFHRSDVLAALIQDYQSIAVAGTHGKTTTSSMIGYLLLQTGLDPTIVVGGEVAAWGGNARFGQGPYLVAEADESDGSLAKLSAYLGVVTNIELDHPDHYNNLDEVVDIFQRFAQNCQILIGSIDCPVVQRVLQLQVSYSLQPELGADYTADQIVYQATGTTARIWERGQVLGNLTLKLLGQHNLSNALAAIAVGRLLNLDFAEIAPVLSTFEGARRRFEHRGQVRGITFIDDYAHHPSEIKATLTAARLQSEMAGKKRRVVAVFQPHRYSRTLTFLDDFSHSFDLADLVVATEIYSAGEPNLGQITGEQLAEAIALHHPQVTYRSTLAEVSDYLKQTLTEDDLVLFLGAGNLHRIIPELLLFFTPPDSELSRLSQ
jgi:UDP-N-acetylmuramate--alanine ligase